MIELEEYNLNLIRRLEKNNYKDYHIKEIDGSSYIRVWDLISCLEDTEDNRDYAEEKVVELTNKINEMPDVEANSLQLSTIKVLNELKAENEELKDTLERIQNTLDEDDYDRLREEGITYFEKI